MDIDDIDFGVQEEEGDELDILNQYTLEKEAEEHHEDEFEQVWEQELEQKERVDVSVCQNASQNTVESDGTSLMTSNPLVSPDDIELDIVGDIVNQSDELLSNSYEEIVCAEFQRAPSHKIIVTEKSNIIQQLVVSTPQQIPQEYQPMSENDEVEIMKAQEQWESITKLRAEQNYGQITGIQEKTRRDMLITYKDALTYFESVDMKSCRQMVRKDLPRPSFSPLTNIKVLLQKMTCYSCGHPILQTSILQDELELIFCISKTPLDHANEELERILVTIYRTLSGDSVACPPVGPHWDLIGFQGGDPKTDLRGAGMFGMLQMLCFLNTSTKMCMDILQLSQTKTQMFPFAVTSLNMTGIVLQLLREGKLTSFANKYGSLIRVANDVYMGLFYKFYLLWKRENRTIIRFDETRKFLQQYAKKNISGLINDFYSSLSAMKSVAQVSQDGSRSFNQFQ